MEEKKIIKIGLGTVISVLVIFVFILAVLVYYFGFARNNKQESIPEKETNDMQAIIIGQNKVEDEKGSSKNENIIINQDDSESILKSDVLYLNNEYGIKFLYPSTFNKTSDTFKESGFEAIEDNSKNRFQLQKTIIGVSKTLKDFVKGQKELMMPDGSNYRDIVKDEEYITLESGIKGYRFECTTKSDNYQIIFMTQKDNEVFQFTFTIEDKKEYDNYIEIANKILNSIILQSNSESTDTTYSNNEYGIEFLYPSTFNKTSDTFKESGFEAIEDNNKNRFQLQKTIIGVSKTLKDFVKGQKELMMPDGSNYRDIVKDEEYITLESGIKGYRFECTTKSDNYQIIFMTQKGNEVFQFTFTVEDKKEYDNYIEIVNKILNSLNIK